MKIFAIVPPAIPSLTNPLRYVCPTSASDVFTRLRGRQSEQSPKQKAAQGGSCSFPCARVNQPWVTAQGCELCEWRLTQKRRGYDRGALERRLTEQNQRMKPANANAVNQTPYRPDI